MLRFTIDTIEIGLKHYTRVTDNETGMYVDIEHKPLACAKRYALHNPWGRTVAYQYKGSAIAEAQELLDAKAKERKAEADKREDGNKSKEPAKAKLAELAAKYEENARDENRTQRARRYCINIANTLDNVANAEAIKLEKVTKDFAAKAEALTRRAEELIKETRGISGDFALMAHTAECAADTAAAAALYYEAAGRVAEIAHAVEDA